MWQSDAPRLTQDGEQVASALQVVNPTVNQAPGQWPNRILDGTLSLDSRQGKLSNEWEMTKHQKSKESTKLHAEVGLFAPSVHDEDALGTLALFKVVSERDAANHIQAERVKILELVIETAFS